MPPLTLRKTPTGWQAGDTDSADALNRYKLDEVIRVSQPARLRNPRQFRLYWALMGELCTYAETQCSKEQVSDWIKEAVGHCETVTRPDGSERVEPKSIALGNMPQEEWEMFFQSVLDFVCTKIIPGTKSDALRSHLEEMI